MFSRNVASLWQEFKNIRMNSAKNTLNKIFINWNEDLFIIQLSLAKFQNTLNQNNKKIKQFLKHTFINL